MRYLLYIVFLVAMAGTPVVEALELEEALAAAAKTTDARSAELQAKSADALYGIASYPGDPTLSLGPTYVRKSVDLLGDASTEAFGASLALSLPLGLSDSSRDKADAASLQAAYGRESLPWSLEVARFKIYGLYANAWIAQEEFALLQREGVVAEEEFLAAQALYRSGSLGYADYRKAEEELTAARDAVLFGGMNQRVTRLELFSWIGLADDGKPLVMKKPVPGTLPKGPELAAGAVINDPGLKHDLAMQALTQAQLERILGFSLPATFKVSLTNEGSVASISYSHETRKLSAVYDSPLVYLSQPVSANPWSFGVSIEVPLDTGGVDSRLAASLDLDARSAKVKTEAAMAKLSLDVRLAYQVWVRASEARDQAERNAALSQEILQTVQAKAKMGQATPTELARAGLDAERAVFNSIVQAISAERQRRSTALLARYPVE